MANEPGATPGTPATPPAAPATPPAGTPPTGTPPAGSEPKFDAEGKVILTTEQYRQLERDAARGRSRKPVSPEVRREQRYGQPPAAGAEDDPEKAELLNQVSETQRENLRLKLNNKVRDLVESDQYKGLSDTAKRILKTNAASLIDPRAKSLDDAIADITDWMEDELSHSSSAATPGTPAVVPGQPPAKTPETPPAAGSPATPPNPAGEESLEGKTGPARSISALKNIMRRGPTKPQA